MELVLLHLPLLDVVVVQRVGKRWHAIVTKTPSIQKALFYRPTEKIQLRLVENRGVWPTPCTFEFDCNLDWGCLSPRPDEHTRWATDPTDSREYGIVINPLLGMETPWSQEYFSKRSEPHQTRDIFSNRTSRRAKASWKKMLFAQPPLKEVLVQHGDRQHWHIVKATDTAVGLTLGDVHQSKLEFDSSVRSIWGKDGFSRGLPAGCTASEVIERLGVEPADEELEDDYHMS